MSFEVLFLAVICAFRPTPLASVYALLSSPRPARPLAAYTIASLVFCAIVGATVVSVLHGFPRPETGTSTVIAVIELAGGVAALGFAAVVVTGRLGGIPRSGHPKGDSRLARQLHNPSLRVAASAGVVTHLPLLLYLLGLNAIAKAAPALVEKLLGVLVFDVIWLAIPFSALVVSIRRPRRPGPRSAGYQPGC